MPTISSTPPALAKANRQRWAAFKLSDRAFEVVLTGDIRRAFRLKRASDRCHHLARQALLTVVPRA